MIDLDNLRAFRAVAQFGSFSVAASRLRIAQSALSRRVRILETQVGMPLFLRHSRGIELTDAGMTIFEKSAAIFDLIEEMRHDLRHRGKRISGRVGIGLPTSISKIIGAELTSSICSKYPDITLRFIESSSDVLVDRVLEGYLDFAIVMDIERGAVLEKQAVLTEPLWVTGHKDILPAPDTGEYEQKSLAELPLVQADHTDAIRRVLDRLFARQEMAPDLALEVTSERVTAALLERGVGCHISTYSNIAELTSFPELVAYPIKNASVTRVIISRASAPRSNAAEIIKNEMLSLISKHGTSSAPIPYSLLGLGRE